MIDQNKLQNLKIALRKYGQDHLLAFWDRLDPVRQGQLIAQINQLDFAQLDRWREEFVLNTSPFKLPDKLAPLRFTLSSRAMPGNEKNMTRRVNWVTS